MLDFYIYETFILDQFLTSIRLQIPNIRMTSYLVEYTSGDYMVLMNTLDMSDIRRHSDVRYLTDHDDAPTKRY